MSARTERSAWSPDEADSLENIDKEIQLVSTSTESQSVSNEGEENRSLGKGKTMSESNSGAEPPAGQSTLNTFHSKSYDNLQAIKLHSFGDMTVQESNSLSNNNVVNSSSTPKEVLNNQLTEKTNLQEHFQSRNKQSVNNCAVKQKETVLKSTVITKSSDKEDYLEQINKQLTKELDEKNAILLLLQENYERLLFKYAEAQNRIDELRIKFLAEKEPRDSQLKQEFVSNHNFYAVEYSEKAAEPKYQKPLITPSINLDQPSSPADENVAPPIRPSSLPLDNSLKFVERDLLKAATPTDSEGLSSIITSMSGHSKILNSLDEENQMNKKSNIYKYKRSNFLLKENTLNDPFDKVKNWQNSLPPLEQIETPETTLYNVNNAYSSTGTNYKEISSPKVEKDFSDESCPLSWKEEPRSYNEMSRSQISSANQFYSKKSSYDGEHFHEGTFELSEKMPPQNSVPAASTTQQRRKRPPLLRCLSLPAYDSETIKSANSKNGIYIPPLDLNNVTLSDDESYCQQECSMNKSNGATSSSLLSSREDPIDRSIQTPQSFSSCKATISEDKVFRQTISKSTSITPDRSRAMDQSLSIYEKKFQVTGSARSKDCEECFNGGEETGNRCNVCGESMSGEKPIFGSRSNSCESVQRREGFPKETPTRWSKPPFKRSVSFGSCTSTPRFCSHGNETPRNYFPGSNHRDSLDNFDAYANNLKARSQLVIKALAAHVNNS